MILFFDTETTGKADFKAPASAPQQPHLVQLGALLCNPDGTEAGILNTIIKPDGWTIPNEVAAIHGITQERAEAEGRPLSDAMLDFDTLVERATLIVAHNINFDLKIMGATYFRKGLPDRLAAKPQFCTMASTTNLCKLKSPWGRGYKWPKLIEAHQHLFNEGFEGAHDAMADVRACARIYFHITK